MRAPAVAPSVAQSARSAGEASSDPVHAIPPAQRKSGAAFMASYIGARQNDLAANPGMLWVDEGAELWKKPAGVSGKSCQSCHGDIAGMKGVAARYPAWDAQAGVVQTLETRIQNCRTANQAAEPLQPESNALLTLSAAVAHQSRGLPVSVSIAGPARAPFDAARRLYEMRLGQLNLSCAHCHEQNWGRKLYAETVSQGHSNGYPTYRLEWQTIGSLYRRLRGCFNSVRATPPEHGSDEHRALELYLAWRATGLPVETPAVRR